jgi:FkbM family methyltransferase
LVARALPKSVRTRLAVYENLRHGEPELTLVRGLLGDRGTLVDVGANDGPYSLLGAQLGRHVIAFEPNARMAAGLRRLLGARGEVHEVALSNAAGSATFFVPYEGTEEVTTRGSLEESAHAELERQRIEVDVATLDSFDIHGVALVKIDVEGHEWPVLQGAVQTLRRERPNLLIEIEEQRAPGNFDRIRELLTDLDYEGCFLLGSDLHPVTTFAVRRHQRPEDAPKWGQRAVGTYVNNFIWVSPSHRDVMTELRKGARRSPLLSTVRMG